MLDDGDRTGSGTALSAHDSLLAYLRGHGPAEIDTYTHELCVNHRAAFYAELVREATGPKLAYFVLQAKDRSASSRYLIVTIGAKAQFDFAWRYDSTGIRDRVLRELNLAAGSWENMTGPGCASFANHSKPGCTLASTQPFDTLASEILEGLYGVEQVFRPSLSDTAPASGDAGFLQVVASLETVCGEYARTKRAVEAETLSGARDTSRGEVPDFNRAESVATLQGRLKELSTLDLAIRRALVAFGPGYIPQYIARIDRELAAQDPDHSRFLVAVLNVIEGFGPTAVGAVPVLVRVLSCPDDLAKRAAREALTAIGSSEAQAALISAGAGAEPEYSGFWVLLWLALQIGVIYGASRLHNWFFGEGIFQSTGWLFLAEFACVIVGILVIVFGPVGIVSLLAFRGAKRPLSKMASSSKRKPAER